MDNLKGKVPNSGVDLYGNTPAKGVNYFDSPAITATDKDLSSKSNEVTSSQAPTSVGAPKPSTATPGSGMR